MTPARSHIHDLVQTYLERHPGERANLTTLLATLDAAPVPTSRATLPAHITCSAVVIRPDGRVLHIHHKATGLVICPGGHVEEADESLLAAALREVREEAGIAPGDLCLTPQTLGIPVDIDINNIDPNPAKGEGAHQHYDFRFAFCLVAEQAEVALQAEEVTGAEWRPLNQVASPSLRAKLRAAGIDGRAEPVNASVLIHDGAGRYLFHLRDNYPGRIWAPGEWALPGGGREPQDTTLTDTLLRELAEEAPGLELTNLEPFAVEQATGVDGLCVPVQIHTASWTGDPDSVPLNEGVMLRWFEPDMLHRLLLRPSTAELVHRHAAQHPAAGCSGRAGSDGRPRRRPGDVRVSALTTVDTPVLLHDWSIPQCEYDRLEQRRGRRHAYTRLDPGRTALVVIDMVPFFDGPYARGVIPQIQVLAGALRECGGLVAWVLPGPGGPSAAREEFYGPQVAELYRTSGGSGPITGRLWPQFTVDEDRDLLVEKAVSSAFFPGFCPLPDLLAERGIDTVVVCGVVTDVCVAGSARDASTLGLRVIVVADGTAAGSDEVHNATLRTLYRSFSDVRPTSEVLDLIRAGR
ncbi:isochorismatase family protein [Kitasatospora indigofera]|uniref:isochorismatase family protein n=1 Tax=Kitasatospora indigofera TaxID=67307 RepID=UPI00363E7065